MMGNLYILRRETSTPEGALAFGVISPNARGILKASIQAPTAALRLLADSHFHESSRWLGANGDIVRFGPLAFVVDSLN